MACVVLCCGVLFFVVVCCSLLCCVVGWRLVSLFWCLVLLCVVVSHDLTKAQRTTSLYWPQEQYLFWRQVAPAPPMPRLRPSPPHQCRVCARPRRALARPRRVVLRQSALAPLEACSTNTMQVDRHVAGATRGLAGDHLELLGEEVCDDGELPPPVLPPPAAAPCLADAPFLAAPVWRGHLAS